MGTPRVNGVRDWSGGDAAAPATGSPDTVSTLIAAIADVAADAPDGSGSGLPVPPPPSPSLSDTVRRLSGSLPVASTAVVATVVSTSAPATTVSKAVAVSLPLISR
jgi:hypothetical protein